MSLTTALLDQGPPRPRNAARYLASAREAGLIRSFLLPTDKVFSIVAAKDVGRVAMDLNPIRTVSLQSRIAMHD
jgi:hypothetical protein